MISIKSLYYQIRYDLLRNHWIRKSKHSRVNGVILMYHHVTDKCVDAPITCKCTVSEFRDALDSIVSLGYSIVAIDEAMNIIRNRLTKKFAVITFDDVPDNFIANAYPILRERGLPFTLFITTGFIDKTGYLSFEQLQELNNDALCTIGAHTVTHPMLRQSKTSFEEILNSKINLEKMLYTQIKYFAYPFGRQSSVSRKVQKEAKRAGYLNAFGTIFAPISDNSLKSQFYLPRVVYKGGAIEDVFRYEFPIYNRIYKHITR